MPEMIKDLFKNNIVYRYIKETIYIPKNLWIMQAHMSHLEQFVFSIREITLNDETKRIRDDHPNPLNKCGKKCFSQTDEDGITLEILRRINKLENGVYAEFGVGDGTENNTLILAAMGWKGFWVGGEELAFKTSSKKFNYQKEWITLGNITELLNKGLKATNSKEIDVISIDLDGNDIYFVEKILENGLKPSLFIVEYNAKFPPPVEFRIKYKSEHIWSGDDYYGASLSAFINVFSKFSYKLVCCNSHTGANAFFVHQSFINEFSDVPDDVNSIYVEPRFHMYYQHGHRPSVKTIERIFEMNID